MSRWVRTLYSGLFIALIPFILLRLFWRGRFAPDYRKRIAQRFGFYSQNFKPNGLWLHAVSVGELMASRPLIEKIFKEYPDLPLTITTMTPTASMQVEKIYADKVQHVYLPYDYPQAVQRFLKAIQPQLAIIMETEIWPNLFFALKDRDIPFVIANARLSEKSFQAYNRVKFFFKPILQSVTVIATQSGLDAEYFKKLGVLDSQVTVMGNLKYDVVVPHELINKAHDEVCILKGNGHRSIWIASSTHTAEEDLIISTAINVKKQIPDALCIIAPRHPERFKPLQEKCLAQGLNVAQYSVQEKVTPNTDILLADTLGELYFFYALSDVALVCGSFAPIGGHNILEPASLGLPIIVGPQMFHFKTILADFIKKDALRQVNESQVLPTLLQLLIDKKLAKEMGHRAQQLVAANQGAVDKLWQVILESRKHVL